MKLSKYKNQCCKEIRESQKAMKIRELPKRFRKTHKQIEINLHNKT